MLKSFVVALLGAALLGAPAQAQQAFWLGKGGQVVGKCPGSRGEPLKAANKTLGDWLLMTAKVNCVDAGSEYRYTVEFVGMAVNGRVRDSIRWPEIPVQWIGLAAFRGKDGGSAVEWLYDDARRVEGRIARDATAPVYFGNLTYAVPKAAVDRAERMLFYVNCGGLYFQFEFLS